MAVINCDSPFQLHWMQKIARYVQFCSAETKKTLQEKIVVEIVNK